jgi:hypothetical protein
MSRKFLVGIDLNKNELSNAVIQNLATAPATPAAGQIYYNTTDNTLYFWSGSAWVNVVQAAEILYGTFAGRPAASTAGRLYYATDNFLLYFDNGTTWAQINNFGTITAQTTYGLTSGNGSSTNFARADHTHGTPALSTNAASNITATTAANGTGTAPAKDDHVHGFTPGNFAVSAFGQALANVNLNSNKIINLATPTADTDAANKAYVDGIAQGLDVKASVHVATTTAGTLATSFANGQTIDGVVLVTGDRILIKNQSTASENGIYTVNATGAPTRSTDMNSAAEFAGAFTFVEEGTTLADTGWVCTTNNPVVVGTTPINWSQFSSAGAYAAGDGLTLVGNVFNVGAGTGITVGADTVSLTNTSLTVNGTSIALGASGTVTAAAGTLTGATLASGVTASSLTSFGASPTIATPTLTLSATTSTANGRIAWDTAAKQIEIGDGTVLRTFTADNAAATLTNKTISGASNTLSNIANGSLTNSSVTVNGTSIALGASGTITAANPNALTLGTGLTGTSYNGSAAVTAAIDTAVVVRKFGANVGDGTSTAITITHNLNTRDVQVTLYENSGTYAEVICDVEHTTVNTVTLRFSTAPTASQYRVTVQG